MIPTSNNITANNYYNSNVYSARPHFIRTSNVTVTNVNNAISGNDNGRNVSNNVVENSSSVGNNVNSGNNAGGSQYSYRNVSVNNNNSNQSNRYSFKINNNTNNPSNTNPYSYSNIKNTSTNTNTSIYNNSTKKILLTIIKSITNKKLSQAIGDIKKYSCYKYNTIQRAMRRVQSNLEVCKFLSFKKLQHFAKCKKISGRYMGVVAAASGKVRKWAIYEAFQQIKKYGFKKMIVGGKVFMAGRGNAVKCAISKIIKRVQLKNLHKLILYASTSKQKQTSFSFIQQNSQPSNKYISQSQQSPYKTKSTSVKLFPKYLLLIKTLQKFLTKRKFSTWSGLLNIGNNQNNDLQHELGQLNKQVDIMRKQLLNKNNQLLELKEKVQLGDFCSEAGDRDREGSRERSGSRERKQNNLYSNHFSNKSYGNYTSSRGLYYGLSKRNTSMENSRRSHKSIGSYKKGSNQDMKEKNSQIGSIQNGGNNNNSILSWLNGSFMSIKSGKSSMSRSITGLDCYCKYRQKYNQYKAETTSLKNQLQIIKSQLQVTKDLNQHLQEQISNLCDTNNTNSNSQSLQLDLIRKQVKDLRRQRDEMKDKLLKNQKYIATLKYQFKIKIQNLYRNLKKPI